MELLWFYLALGSAFFFAIKDLLAKKLFKEKKFSEEGLLFEEYLLLLILVLLFLFPKVEFASFYGNWGLFLSKGIFLFMANYIYFLMLRKYEISLVSPLINLTPIALVVLSYFLLSEQLTFLQILGISITILAVYFLEIIKHHHHKTEPLKHHFSLFNLKSKDSIFFILSVVMVLAFSITAVIDKFIFSSGITVYTNLYFTALIVLVILTGILIKEKRLKKSISEVVREPKSLFVAFFANVSQVLVLFAIAIPGALISLIIPIRRLSTLISSIFGGILFHEKHLKKKFFYTLLMLVGVVLIVV
ncbi:MAG: EamA family transporter [Nanoarchaeota archaeon]